MSRRAAPSRIAPPPISGGAVPETSLPVPIPAGWSARGKRWESPFAQGVRRLRRSRTSLVGAAIVAALLLTALFADVLAPQSPIASDQSQTFAAPSREHPLGTDQLGRDIAT